MAIYRPSRPRYRVVLIAAAAGLVTGFVAGWIVGDEDPDPATAVREVRVSLTEAASLLEVVEVEYEEALGDGSGEGDPEYEGARDALTRSRSRWGDARAAVEVLTPEAAAEVDRQYDELEQAVEREALPEEVNAMIGDLSEALVPDG